MLDARTKLYRELREGRGARTLGDYLAGKGTREDEELLTEPILAELRQERRRTVQLLLQDGRLLVEAAERLVCRLYSMPRELEDEILAHATGRAERAAGARSDE
ncbi:MAG TPA: hypothetical protein VIM22_04975 [Solirubrobacteraceae bacterium]